MSTDNAYAIEEFQLRPQDGNLGLVLGMNLAVAEVTPGSSASRSSIQPGDYLISINGDLVKGPASLQSLSKDVDLAFVKVFRPQPGNEYILIDISYARNAAFGLYLKDLHNRVFVCQPPEPETLAYRAGLKEGDYFVHVNGHSVTKKDVAKELIVNYIKKTRTVTMLVERAVTEDAKRHVSRAREVSKMQPPSLMMNSDVRRIAEAEQTRMRNDPQPEQQNLMVDDIEDYAEGPRVRIVSQHQSVRIRTDNPNANLKRVPPKKK